MTEESKEGTRFQLVLDPDDAAMLNELVARYKLTRTDILRLLVRNACRPEFELRVAG